MNIGVIIYSILLWVLLFLITIHTRLKRASYLAAMSWIMEPKGRKQIVIFKKITTVFFFPRQLKLKEVMHINREKPNLNQQVHHVT